MTSPKVRCGGVSYSKGRLRAWAWGLSGTQQAAAFTLATSHVEILARAANADGAELEPGQLVAKLLAAGFLEAEPSLCRRSPRDGLVVG